MRKGLGQARSDELLAFLVVQVCWRLILPAVVTLKMSLFHLPFKRIFSPDIKFQPECFCFSFITFKDFVALFYVLHCFK